MQLPMLLKMYEDIDIRLFILLLFYIIMSRSSIYRPGSKIERIKFYFKSLLLDNA